MLTDLLPYFKLLLEFLLAISPILLAFYIQLKALKKTEEKITAQNNSLSTAVQEVHKQTNDQLDKLNQKLTLRDSQLHTATEALHSEKLKNKTG